MFRIAKMKRIQIRTSVQTTEGNKRRWWRKGNARREQVKLNFLISNASWINTSTNEIQPDWRWHQLENMAWHTSVVFFIRFSFPFSSLFSGFSFSIAHSDIQFIVHSINMCHIQLLFHFFFFFCSNFLFCFIWAILQKRSNIFQLSNFRVECARLICLYDCAPAESEKWRIKMLIIICITVSSSSFSIVCHVCRLLIVCIYFSGLLSSWFSYMYMGFVSFFLSLFIPFYAWQMEQTANKWRNEVKRIKILIVCQYTHTQHTSERKDGKKDDCKNWNICDVCYTHLSCQQYFRSANEMILYYHA